MREYEVRVEFCATVKLPLPDGEEAPNCCDPDNEMTDRSNRECHIKCHIAAVRGVCLRRGPGTGPGVC